MRFIYMANACAAIAIGVAFFLFARPLKDLYAGRDAAEDLIRVLGMASIGLAIVTITVVHSAGWHFMVLARPMFCLAYILIAPITTLAFAKWGAIGRIAFIVDAGLVLALAYLPDFGAAQKSTEIIADWQDKIRDTASRQERTRLAQELHDSIKQQIFSIQTNLAAAEARWDSDRSSVQQAIAHARSSAREAMAETTAMLDQLQASPLEGVGLVEALRRQGEALAFRTGAQVETRLAEIPDAAAISKKIQTAVLRIAQEALSNIARHARAKHVRLEFGPIPNQAELLLLIQDDGQGFQNDQMAQGMGLANMRARAESIGATLTVDGQPGAGCIVSLRLNPALETDRKRAQYRKTFRGNLFLAATCVVLAAGKGYSEGELLRNEMVMFYLLGAFALAVAGISGWRYRRLRSNP